MAQLMELLQQLIEGNEKAFEQIYSEYHRQVFLFVLKFTKDESASQEITQRAFIQLWIKRENMSAEKPLSGQLFILVRNLTIDTLRKQAREKKLFGNYKTLTSSIDNQTSESIHYEDLKEQAAHLIDTLPERRREIFLLSREEGLTYPEIAEKLGISQKTVENQMSKAIKTLREKLGPLLYIFI